MQIPQSLKYGRGLTGALSKHTLVGGKWVPTEGEGGGEAPAKPKEEQPKVSPKQVREKIGTVADSLSQSAGVWTARRGFFYTHGKTSADFVGRIKEALPEAEIVDSGTVDKPFRGGGSTAANSHWWVKFRVKA